ncbi:MAG: methyltransferase [Gammaproteobacteria bacterium]|nr:methyltransferase [Gammaproteobacteria bacterium]MDP2140445.1 methyltransferase [Gammaproteobacteria bacterium]MDP2349484.1 methyltransferase [Gammaproteobacteria bacterium]
MSMHLEHTLIDLLNQPNQSADTTLWIVDENLAAEQLLAVHPRANLLALTNRFEVGEALQARGLKCSVSDFAFAGLPVQQFTRIVYRVSKERAVVYHCINESFKLLAPGGSLHLLGHKDDGIKTNGRNAEQVFRSTARLQKHGTAYSMSIVKPTVTAAPENLQWLDSKDYSRLRDCRVGDFSFISKPGVFGWNKIDHGSELLAREALAHLSERSDAGSVLDLGCGYGYLLMATAALPFARRTATDNNAAAVLAASANFAKLQIAVTVTLDDCGTHLSEQFDVILCNPPFHQGFSTSSALAEKFLLQIRKLLNPNGEAMLVVNQFIPIERVAAPHFANITTLSHTDGFKITLLS